MLHLVYGQTIGRRQGWTFSPSQVACLTPRRTTHNHPSFTEIPFRGPGPQQTPIVRIHVIRRTDYQQVITMNHMRLVLSKAVILILSISMILIFLLVFNERSTQPSSVGIAYHSFILFIVIALDVYMWNVLRCGGPRIMFTVRCPEDTGYCIRVDGKKKRYEGIAEYYGTIDDEIYCKKGHHTLSVESGGSIESMEIDVDDVASITIRIYDGIEIEPDHSDRTDELDPRSLENKAVLLYAAFCFFMAAMAIITMFFDEIRSS